LLRQKGKKRATRPDPWNVYADARLILATTGLAAAFGPAAERRPSIHSSRFAWNEPSFVNDEGSGAVAQGPALPP
jgi:hypothetical protein